MMRRFALLAAGACVGALATGGIAQFGATGATACRPGHLSAIEPDSATCSSASAPITSKSRKRRS
jgi:hypothetical protein